ncbi:MAG: hypothetical protein WC389_05465 [Lutibacter sp.]|jgi:hypothetical protein
MTNQKDNTILTAYIIEQKDGTLFIYDYMADIPISMQLKAKKYRFFKKHGLRTYKPFVSIK